MSPGDLALNDFRFADLISNGSSVNLNILNQTIAPEDLCRLLLVIDPDDNCICVPASAPLQGPFEYQAVQSLSLCSGDTIMLGRPTLAGNTYQWESAEGLLCTDCATASYTRENPGFNPMTFPLYLNVINPDDCQLRFEYLVTVQPIPGIWSADSEICAGDTALLLASPGTNYQWQGPSIINPNQQSQAVSPMLTATYFVTITDASGCTGIDSAQVMVIESPIANAGENIQTCTGAEVQLSAEENPAYTYLWSPGFPALDDPTSPTPMVLTSSDQTFTLTVFNETCSATDEVEVSFFDGLDLQFTGPQSACRGDTIILELNGADQYLWQPSFIGMCQDAGCSIVQLALDADTEFTITATTDDGCIDTLMIDIEVLAAEVVEMAELNACEGQSVDLYGVLRDSPGTYCDTMPSASGCLEIRCTELTFTNTISTDESAAICFGDTLDFNGESYSSTGNYCITYTAAGGCDSVHCLDLMVYPEAELTISPEAPVIEKGESIQLNASSGLEDYRWTPEETLSCSDCPDPIADPLEDTRYIVTATDERECPASDTVLVRVVTICEAANLLIPDAFTANDNGKNDRFRIANLVDFAGTVSIEVYNRWGERVYFERGNEGWDGTFKGEPAPEAVYLYLIRAQCDGEDEQFYKGNVTLLR